MSSRNKTSRFSSSSFSKPTKSRTETAERENSRTRSSKQTTKKPLSAYDSDDDEKPPQRSSNSKSTSQRTSERHQETSERHHRSSKSRGKADDDKEDEEARRRQRHKEKEGGSDDGAKPHRSSHRRREKKEEKDDDAPEPTQNNYEDDFEDDDNGSEEEVVKKTSNKSQSEGRHRRGGGDSGDSDDDRNRNHRQHRSNRRGGGRSSDEDEERRGGRDRDRDRDRDYRDRDRDRDRERGRVVRANALVSVPTERVETYKTKLHFSHDSRDRQRRRANDLLKLIEMDKKSFNLIDINPEGMQTVYSSHLKHAKCQTNDDIVEIEMQTDDIESVTKWTQCPPDDSKGFGAENEKNHGAGDDENLFQKLRLEVNYMDLQRFLNTSSKVIETLLREHNANEHDAFALTTKGELEFSQGYTKFSVPKFLSRLARTFILVNCTFCRDDANLFACVYNIKTLSSKTTKFDASIIIVWNLNKIDVPHRILICESLSTSLCFTSFMIFSGNVDGSVVVWDLRESSSMHMLNFNQKGANEFTVIRSPTYATAGVLFNENHISEVKSLIPLQNTAKTSNRKGIFMQLASLEIECKLIIWTVVELSHVDLAGYETDLGLLPGGRIKLVKSTQIDINNLIRTEYGKIQYLTLSMASPNNQVNDFYICTNVGRIIHIVREGSKSTSSVLHSELVVDGLLQVNGVAFHHEMSELLLAGYGNGELRLYHRDFDTPIKTWHLGCEGNAVRTLAWIESRKSAFIVVDELNTLYLWDLLVDDTRPLVAKSVENFGGLCISSMSKTSSESNNKEAKVPFIMFYQNSVDVEVHLFTSTWTSGSEKEAKKFNRLIKNYLLTF